MKEEDTLVERILKHLGFWQDEPQLRNILTQEEELSKLYLEYNLTVKN